MMIRMAVALLGAIGLCLAPSTAGAETGFLDRAVTIGAAPYRLSGLRAGRFQRCENVASDRLSPRRWRAGSGRIAADGWRARERHSRAPRCVSDDRALSPGESERDVVAAGHAGSGASRVGSDDGRVPWRSCPDLSGGVFDGRRRRVSDGVPLAAKICRARRHGGPRGALYGSRRGRERRRSQAVSISQ